MIISKDIIDELSFEAKSNVRLRMNYNLHHSSEDQVQRLFNALEPGTMIPIQRHLCKDETLILLRGAFRVLFYDDNQNIILDECISNISSNYGVHIPRGTWHSIECLETDTVVFEVNDGPYRPLSENEILN